MACDEDRDAAGRRDGEQQREHRTQVDGMEPGDVAAAGEEHHLVEVIRGGQVADAGEDLNVEVHGSAQGRCQAVGRQEPVVFAVHPDG